MRALRAVLITTVLAGAASNAAAQTIVWNLDGVAFADGGTASGFVTYRHDANPANRAVVDFSVTVSGGNTGAFPEITYSPSNSATLVQTLGACGQPSLVLATPNLAPGRRDLRLTPASILDGSTTPVALDLGCSGSIECFNCSPSRVITSGNLVFSAVPSMDFWLLAVLAVSLIGAAAWMLWRRRGLRFAAGA